MPLPYDTGDLAGLAGYPPSVNPEGSGPDYASLLGYGSPATPPVAPPGPPGPVTSPDQVTGAAGAANESSYVPTPTAAAPSPLGSIAAGSGVSVSGYSPGAMAAIQKGPGSKLEKQIAADEYRTAADYQPIVDQQHAAAAADQAATDAMAHIESQKLQATSESKQAIAAAQQDYMAKEAAAVEEARAEAETVHGQYRAALLDYAASGVNPSQLWESAGTRGQIGMLVTAFTHDFLGAKGIQTSGLDSINAAINRNIESQLTNMRKKQDVAAGFKSLWEMQRSQSASDREARDRMRGFYLAGMQTALDAKLSGYDSELANAKGMAAKAAIQKELAKNDLAVRQHVDATANARAAQRVSAYGHELAASSARYSADAHIRAAEIAANAKAAPGSPLEGLIFDTSESGKNKASRRFLPGTPPEKQHEIRLQDAKVKDTAKNVLHLADIQSQIDSVPPGDIGAINRLQSEQKRVAELVRNVTKMGIIYDNSGKQINEQEVKLYDEIVAKKDWFTNGDNLRQLATLAKMQLDKQAAVMGAVSTKIGPGDPAYGLSSGVDDSAPGERTLAGIESADGSGRHENTAVDQHIKSLHSPGAGTFVTPDSLPEDGPINRHFVDQAWSTFLKDNPWATPTASDAKRRAGPDTGFFSPDQVLREAVGSKAELPDQAFVDILSLGSYALAGDKKAAAELDALAAGKPGTASVDNLEAAYAAWLKASNPDL